MPKPIHRLHTHILRKKKWFYDVSERQMPLFGDSSVRKCLSYMHKTCVFCFFPSEPMQKHRKGGVPLQSRSLGGRHRCFPWHVLAGKASSRLAREPFSSKSRQCLRNGSKSCPLAYTHTKSSHTHTYTRTKTTYFLSFVVPRFYLAT